MLPLDNMSYGDTVYYEENSIKSNNEQSKIS